MFQEPANTIIKAVLTAADPQRALARHWTQELDEASRVVLLACGKASAPMAREAIERLGPRIRLGAIACVPEHEQQIHTALRANPPSGPVEVCPADHPLPTGRNLIASKALADAAGLATDRDVVLALISGGASAHLAMPVDGVTLDELRALTSAIQRAGATIRELNAVRKHAERLKGGGLARLVHPARLRVMVLSDVLGDPIDAIGSGPTAPDPTTFADALGVLDRYDLRRVSPSITAHLVRGARGEETETPKPGDEVVESARHTIIANNQTAVDAAAQACAHAGFPPARVRTGVEGEASEVATRFAAELIQLAATGQPASLIWGGETTVTVGDAQGKGGRNTELALAIAGHISDCEGIQAIALATDGVDGPTDAAGAVVSQDTVCALNEQGLQIKDALRRHDSYNALDRVGALIKAGPTGTNINDVLVGIVR